MTMTNGIIPGAHLREIAVTGLNDSLRYNIRLNGDGLTLLTGPNGYGKTSILRLIDGIFSRSIVPLVNVLYQTVTLRMNDEVNISVEKEIVEPDNVCKLTFVVGRVGKKKSQRQTVSFPLDEFDEESTYLFAPDLDRFIQRLEMDGIVNRVAANRWRTRQGEILTREQVFRRFVRGKQDILRERIMPDWFVAETVKYPTQFVNAQRLNAVDSQSAVGSIASGIQKEIQNARNEYGDKNSLLDQDFTKLILSDTELKEVSREELTVKLHELSDLWDRYKALSLLGDTATIPIAPNLPEGRLPIATAYVERMFEKLKAFEDIERRLTTFSALINEHFELGKYVEFNRERGISVRTENGRPIPLERLSSGEQHLLVLFGSLLFGQNRACLVLIDEPELSLHPAWQKSFLTSIERIKEVVNVDFIMATHAPALVAEHQDLMIDLWNIKDA